MAAFHNPTYQAAWEAAKQIIEAAAFTLTQAEAPDASASRFALVDRINELLTVGTRHVGEDMWSVGARLIAPLPARGIYIVTNGNETVKVIY